MNPYQKLRNELFDILQQMTPGELVVSVVLYRYRDLAIVRTREGETYEIETGTEHKGWKP